MTIVRLVYKADAADPVAAVLEAAEQLEARGPHGFTFAVDIGPTRYFIQGDGTVLGQQEEEASDDRLLPSDIQPESFKGHGDRLCRLARPLAHGCIRFEHAGSSNFFVTTVNENGETENLVNTIGRIKGSLTANIGERTPISAVQVEGDGDWKVKIGALSSASLWDGGALSKQGPRVMQLLREVIGLIGLRVTYPGTHAIGVWASDGGGRDLLISDIGPYSGEVRIPPGTKYIEVDCDGKWSARLT